ncbi:MAG TPA: kelch repeat-containing protein, partial [Gemmatimonadales bacterium]|nr:kelch repeat-containing protein [Gemmatimonadales bacterium]
MRHRSLLAFTLAAFGAGCGGDGTGPAAGPAPTITGVSPATGTVGTELTITGTNFRAGADVFVGPFQSDSVDVAGGAQLFARVPTGVVAGQSYAVRVRNADGTEAQRAAAFTAVAPTLQFVNGATRPSGNVGSTVILEGLAFGDEQGPGKVLFSNGSGGTVEAVIADPQNDWTDGFIVTTVPSGAATGDLAVVTGTGTSNALTFTVTTEAAFSPSAISWTQTTSLPVGLSGHRAVFAPVGTTNLVYVLGGADSTHAPRRDVRYAAIGADGHLTAWTLTDSLPAPRAFHAVVVATPFNSRVKGDGYIYVLGGAVDAAGTPANTVYRGTLAADGSIAAWTSVATLPAALHSLGAVIFRGEIYIGGGSGSGNVPVASVYRARIDTLGNLESWRALAPLPGPRSYHGWVTFGGYLYAFGGDTSAVTPNDSNFTDNTKKLKQIVYNRISLRTGELVSATWTLNAAELIKEVSKHTAVIAGGSVLISGGLYAGAATGSTEQSYAGFNSDGSVGSLNGATGAQTIQSQNGGRDLFNHAALSYIDASGVAHVLVLGGDDASAPSRKRPEV